MSVLTFFKYFEVVIASIVEFVIKVDRRSSKTKVEDFFELNKRVKPLSVIFMHLENLRERREFRYWDYDIAYNMLFEHSVQPRSRDYSNFIELDLIKSINKL
jgi:hypothetical protein